MTFPVHILIYSRECSTGILARFAGSEYLPERAVGAAIVNALRRPNGSTLCVTASAMEDLGDQLAYYVRLAMPGQADLRPGLDRVQVICLDDTTPRWLSEKLLDESRPDSAEACRLLAAEVKRAHDVGLEVILSSFEPSWSLERLAERLGIPGDQAPARFIPLGAKAAGREVFRAADVPVAAGTEKCHNIDQLARAIVPLVRHGVRRVVLKLDSALYAAGLGNAVLDLERIMPADASAATDFDLAAAIAKRLPLSRVVDGKLGWSGFSEAIATDGVLAEELISGAAVRSPSFQGRLSPDGVSVVSTHEQVLAPNGLSFTGCSFPALAEYQTRVVEYGRRVGEALRSQGLEYGDYGVDFVAVRDTGDWRIYGCELNLRSTGTRHGFELVTGLLGVFPSAEGELVYSGERRVYLTSDSIVSERFVGLRPRTLIDAIQRSPLHYEAASRRGVVLYMLSSLPRYGKFGAVCIGATDSETATMMADLRRLAGEVRQRQRS